MRTGNDDAVPQSGSFELADYHRSLIVNGLERSYLVHIPKGGADEPRPVVLAFHGNGSNAEQMALFCGLDEKADEAGFIAVYPNGTGRLRIARSWNGGNCCGHAAHNQVDDVGFVRDLLDDLAGFVRIDAKRVYATGMSNGAVMAYRLASEMADRVAAIAPVAGPMGTESCAPSRPVSVIHFHGTNDEFAPLEGGKGPKSLSGTKFYSVEHSIRAWIAANGCNEIPAIEELPDRVNDGTRVTRKTYADGKDGTEVVLFVIEAGGHTWPGREPTLKALGKATMNLSANDLMWEFFQKHPMR